MSPKRARLSWGHERLAGAAVGLALFCLGWIAAYDQSVRLVYRVREQFVETCVMGQDRPEPDCIDQWRKALSPR